MREVVCRRIAATGLVVVLLPGCQASSGTNVSYCEAVADLQAQWGYQRTLEGRGPESMDQLEDAIEVVERHNNIVAGAAPQEVRSEWEAIGGDGKPPPGAVDKVLDHADEECGSDLRGIFDGLSPEEQERYATPPAEA